jgi:1,4-dihydroxy-2-naphthoate octaprenyltransferase
MPVIFGTALAVVVGGARFSLLRALWALATMVAFHAAANMLSDVYDFRRGLDREVTPVSGAVVRGWLTDRRVFRGAALLFGLATISGLLIAAVTGRSLFVIGAVGLAVGAFYTVLKAHALGDLAVFLDFGLLGGGGAWVVQTGSFSWLPIVWTVPMAMLVIAILHANNWRDIASDRERRVTTVAGRLGDHGSFVYYGLLIFGPFVIDLAFVAGPRIAGGPLRPLPLTFGLVLLALPSAFRLWGRAVRRAAPRRPMDFVILDGATANLNLVFGLLSAAAVILEGFLSWG